MTSTFTYMVLEAIELWLHARLIDRLDLRTQTESFDRVGAKYNQLTPPILLERKIKSHNKNSFCYPNKTKQNNNHNDAIGRPWFQFQFDGIVVYVFFLHRFHFEVSLVWLVKHLKWKMYSNNQYLWNSRLCTAEICSWPTWFERICSIHFVQTVIITGSRYFVLWRFVAAREHLLLGSKPSV